MLIGAIDAGGSKVLTAVMKADGTVLARCRDAVPTADVAAYFARCAEMLAVCAREAKTRVEDLRGVGVNIPGMVTPDGRVLGSPSAGWGAFDARPLLANAPGFAGLPLFFENDINACALAEKRFGGAGGDFIWVTVSNGCGGAVVADGRLVRGAANCAGEIGHVKVERQNPLPCGCGGYGCLEAHVSGPAIARRAVAAGLPAGTDAKRCAELARQGDPAAQTIYDESGFWLGRALAVAANLLNPAGVYLGGGVSGALDLMMPGLQLALASDVLPQCRGMRVEPTRLGYEAALMGAAAVCLEGMGLNLSAHKASVFEPIKRMESAHEI